MRVFTVYSSLEERQNMVELLVNDTVLRQNLTENYLKRFPDFQKIEWRFIKKKANLQVTLISKLLNQQFII